MLKADSQQQVQLAILDFTMGDYASALNKLDSVLNSSSPSLEAMLAKTEVLYAMQQYDEALKMAEQAEQAYQDDVHLKTSLSRIWMQLGDTTKAEKYSAEAKMLTWKAEILQPSHSSPSKN